MGIRDGDWGTTAHNAAQCSKGRPLADRVPVVLACASSSPAHSSDTAPYTSPVRPPSSRTCQPSQSM